MYYIFTRIFDVIWVHKGDFILLFQLFKFINIPISSSMGLFKSHLLAPWPVFPLAVYLDMLRSLAFSQYSRLATWPFFHQQFKLTCLGHWRLASIHHWHLGQFYIRQFYWTCLGLRPINQITTYQITTNQYAKNTTPSL